MVPGSSCWSALPSEGRVAHEPRDGVGAGHGHDGDRSSQDGDVDWPMAVLPSEAAALVAAYQRAQAAELIVRRMLARMGLTDAVETVATLDNHGRPVARLTLSADRLDIFVQITALVNTI